MSSAGHGSNSRRGGGGGGGGGLVVSDSGIAAAQSRAHQIRNREREYRADIVMIQEQIVGFATSALFLQDLPLEESISQSEEWQTFVEEQKQRLFQIGTKLVTQNQSVTAFTRALDTIVSTNGPSDTDGSAEVDYESYLTQEFEKEQSKWKENDATATMDSDSAELLKTIQVALGMNPTTTSGGKNGNKDGNGHDDDDDDDLQVMPQSKVSLKCPISGGLLEEPVKCRICQHVYSKSALESYLQQQSRHANQKKKRRHDNSASVNCPVVGCNNANLSLESCVADKTMEMKVQSHRRQQARQDELRASQAVDCDEDDDEEEF